MNACSAGSVFRRVQSPIKALAFRRGWFTGLSRPHFLPTEAGERVLLYTSGHTLEPSIVVHDLDSGRQEIIGIGSRPVYSSSGHLIYERAVDTHELWARPFSLDSLQPTGEAFLVTHSGRGPTVAADQTLVYLDGNPRQRQLVWLDRSGTKVGEIGSPQIGSRDPTLSPDGRYVAVAATEGVNQDIWIWDVARGVKSRLTTSAGDDQDLVWSPDGIELAFSSPRSGSWDVFLRRSDGAGEPKALIATSATEHVLDWSRDGKHILFVRVVPETVQDLWYLELNEDDDDWAPKPFLQTRFSEMTPKLSPDGRFIAYRSNESGRSEIYVRSFPDGDGKVTVSRNGGDQPRWSRDGSEILYVEDGALMVVAVSTSPSFSVGSVTRLFEHVSLSSGLVPPQYDVSANGRRFVLVEQADEETPEPKIHIVENWYEEFRDREKD